MYRRSGAVADAARCLAEAVELWGQGPPPDPPVFGALVEAYRQARLDLAGYAVELGEHDLAVDRLGPYLLDNTTDERAWLLLVQAHTGAGRVTDALQACRDAQAHLGTLGPELGAWPDRLRTRPLAVPPTSRSPGPDRRRGPWAAAAGAVAAVGALGWWLWVREPPAGPPDGSPGQSRPGSPGMPHDRRRGVVDRVLRRGRLGALAVRPAGE